MSEQFRKLCDELDARIDLIEEIAKTLGNYKFSYDFEEDNVPYTLSISRLKGKTSQLIDKTVGRLPDWGLVLEKMGPEKMESTYLHRLSLRDKLMVLRHFPNFMESATRQNAVLIESIEKAISEFDGYARKDK